MNKILNNKLYLSMLLMLLALTALLNVSPKLLVCSGIYTLLIFTASSMSEIYGKKNTMLALILSVLVNVILAFKNIDLMLISSFSSVLVSVYWGINSSINLKSRFSFPVRNFITLVLCSVIDTILMTSTLLTKFSIKKALYISFGDLLLKLSYSLTASLFVLAIVYLSNQYMKSEQN